MPRRFTIPTAIAALASFTATALPQVLTGSGSNLPLAGPPPANAAPVRSGITPAGFTGTWSSPALPAWVGSYAAGGPVPSGTGATGFTSYDFTTMPTGLLPAGTFMVFSDVDGGSQTNETFVLRAFDASNNLLTSEWLDQSVGEAGNGTGPGGTILSNNLPGWEWDATSSTYTIAGTTSGGNPSAAVFLPTNTGIAFLELERTSGFASFGLGAPVPAPGAAALLGLGAAAGLRRRSR